ncbi:MAG: hypothetical protein MUP45_00385, partial [Candidatus Marinimicrobia bacterium]|nr:hypothetical protein [Candidatus Neomarinimicrobiota bacterium]
IPNTCGKCHSNIKKEYLESIHGQLVMRGNTDAPACTYCHGEHNILNVKDPNAEVAFQNVSKQILKWLFSTNLTPNFFFLIIND